ncbi:hypothetical protein QYS62_008480 [Fusarium acuminatum]|uniref:Trichothecene efflux pump n=1 Tax=Fusarium acuminatum TaxID=5515 RepID=A0ABZ2X3D9_9HYPO
MTAQLETQEVGLRHGLQGSGALKLDNPGIDAGEEEQEGLLRPSLKFTSHQLFYVFGLDGVGAMVLSGGVNFALAYRDAAVTIIIQCILTWFVEMGLVRYDLSKRSVQPIGFIPQPSYRWLRWLFFLPPSSDPNDSEEESEKAPKDTSKAASTFNTIAQGALRGFILAVVGFILLWPMSVGILTTLGERDGGDWRYNDRWVPQAFKAILGGVLGLLTTPLMALFWLIKAGWEGNDERSDARESRRSQYAQAQALGQSQDVSAV